MVKIIEGPITVCCSGIRFVADRIEIRYDQDRPTSVDIAGPGSLVVYDIPVESGEETLSSLLAIITDGNRGISIDELKEINDSLPRLFVAASPRLSNQMRPTFTDADYRREEAYVRGELVSHSNDYDYAPLKCAMEQSYESIERDPYRLELEAERRRAPRVCPIAARSLRRVGRRFESRQAPRWRAGRWRSLS